MKNTLKNIAFLVIVGLASAGSVIAECNQSVTQTANKLVEFRVAQLKGLTSDIQLQELQECVELHQTNPAIGSEFGEVFSNITQTIDSARKQGDY